MCFVICLSNQKSKQTFILVIFSPGASISSRGLNPRPKDNETSFLPLCCHRRPDSQHFFSNVHQTSQLFSKNIVSTFLQKDVIHFNPIGQNKQSF